MWLLFSFMRLALTILQTSVTMQALKEEPSVLRCLDDFLVQCVAVPAGATVQDVTPEIVRIIRL